MSGSRKLNNLSKLFESLICRWIYRDLVSISYLVSKILLWKLSYEEKEEIYVIIMPVCRKFYCNHKDKLHMFHIRNVLASLKPLQSWLIFIFIIHQVVINKAQSWKSAKMYMYHRRRLFFLKRSSNWKFDFSVVSKTFP